MMSLRYWNRNEVPQHSDSQCILSTTLMETSNRPLNRGAAHLSKSPLLKDLQIANGMKMTIAEAKKSTLEKAKAIQRAA